MKTVEELKTFYDGLDSAYEGYIQMSNRVLETFKTKPSWESMHENKNFIFEGCMYDGDRSIMIRQVNDKFVVIDQKISDIKNKTQELFFAKSDNRVKIIQVWEEKEDVYCENFKVLKPTLQLFAGFEGGLK